MCATSLYRTAPHLRLHTAIDTLTSTIPSENWLEEAWELREEQIYPAIFGTQGDGTIYVLDHTIFDAFQVAAVDPRWLTHGIFKYAPTPTRNTWIYVTSGLSNDWWSEEPDPAQPSGLGCELVLETEDEAEWAMVLISRLLAFQLLLGWGHYQDREPMSFGDRIPLRAPIDGQKSQLTFALVIPPSTYTPRFELPSGTVEFLHLIGITEAEAAFAREHGYQALLPRIPAVTNPARM